MDKQVVWNGKISGETIFEREYEPSYAGKSFQIDGGYICIGILTDDTGVFRSYVYSMLDKPGNLLWTTHNPWPTTYEQNLEQYPLQVIYNNGFIYIFYGEMHGIKLDSKGNILWLKRFTFPHDQFNSVMMNRNQNFVLLATHRDIDGDAIEDDKGEVFVIEIDTDGKIID